MHTTDSVTIYIHIGNIDLFHYVRKKIEEFSPVEKFSMNFMNLQEDAQPNDYINIAEENRTLILFKNLTPHRPICDKSTIISKYIDDRYDQSMGYQRHISGNGEDNHVSLGKLRSMQHECESLLRECEHLHFNLDAIRRSDIPDNISSSSTGLTVAEACQLMRYAGEATAARILTFSCDVPHWDPEGIAIDVIATLSWYYLEGLSQPKHHPADGKNFKSFLIEADTIDCTLEFLKSDVDEKWWLKIPDGKLIPVSFEDYQRAINNHISNHIISHF